MSLKYGSSMHNLATSPGGEEGGGRDSVTCPPPLKIQKLILAVTSKVCRQSGRDPSTYWVTSCPFATLLTWPSVRPPTPPPSHLDGGCAGRFDRPPANQLFSVTSSFLWGSSAHDHEGCGCIISLSTTHVGDRKQVSRGVLFRARVCHSQPRALVPTAPETTLGSQR